MLTRHAPVALVAALALVAAGCQPVIQIVKPDRSTAAQYDPVPTVMVNFTSNFKPTEAWNVSLDSGNITGFSPTPVPGGTSSANITITGSGSHTVTAQGTCGTFCSYPSDTVTFTPPALMYNSASYVNGSQNLKQFVAASVYVGVQNFRQVPLTVQIVETTLPHHVKLAPAGGAFLPPGATLTVTIPATTTKADFMIQADVLGTYNLKFTSPGSAQGFGAGNVTP
jgi:hypothetical protein